jgi:hypothetical protein
MTKLIDGYSILLEWLPCRNSPKSMTTLRVKCSDYGRSNVFAFHGHFSHVERFADAHRLKKETNSSIILCFITTSMTMTEH